jgi:hypothetical protein
LFQNVRFGDNFFEVGLSQNFSFRDDSIIREKRIKKGETGEAVPKPCAFNVESISFGTASGISPFPGPVLPETAFPRYADPETG